MSIPSNEGALVPLIFHATTNATSVKYMNFDRRDYDYANIEVMCESHDSSTPAIQYIYVADNDTVTSASSMTAIAALSSETSTSTNASNILPTAATMAKGGVVNAIQIDLRKRKRNMGLTVKAAAVAAGCGIGAICRLTRSHESADSATEKAAVPNKADTNYSGCMALITG